ncbi:hypothetical protein COO60DRAFT_1569080 [Scenedesmus sp. NREL 46B-D3]|nr:hypothetical protein COO60DRAFT_1569080 [Scenedesmus sp. NREL 46B-D3]
MLVPSPLTFAALCCVMCACLQSLYMSFHKWQRQVNRMMPALQGFSATQIHAAWRDVLDMPQTRAAAALCDLELLVMTSMHHLSIQWHDVLYMPRHISTMASSRGLKAATVSRVLFCKSNGSSLCVAWFLRPRGSNVVLMWC